MRQANSKLAMMDLYLLSRRIIKRCKQLDSDRIMTSLILFNLKLSPKTIRGLSDIFDTKHSWMSSMISKLENAGWITKEKHKDPRCKLIKLTPAGVQAEKESGKQMAFHYSKAFADMTDKEIEDVINISLGSR